MGSCGPFSWILFRPRFTIRPWRPVVLNSQTIANRKRFVEAALIQSLLLSANQCNNESVWRKRLENEKVRTAVKFRTNSPHNNLHSDGRCQSSTYNFHSRLGEDIPRYRSSRNSQLHEANSRWWLHCGGEL